MSTYIKGSLEKIRASALVLFADRGIKSTTTKEIARKAGISEGSIYRHFKSKDDLAFTLFIEHMNEFREILSTSIIDINKSGPALERLIITFYDFAKNEPLKYAYIIIGHHTELKKMKLPDAKPMDIFTGTIERGVKDGDFREIDPLIAASYIIGMITRSIMFYNNSLIDCSYEDLVSETIKSSKRILYK